MVGGVRLFSCFFCVCGYYLVFVLVGGVLCCGCV